MSNCTRKRILGKIVLHEFVTGDEKFPFSGRGLVYCPCPTGACLSPRPPDHTLTRTRGITRFTPVIEYHADHLCVLPVRLLACRRLPHRVAPRRAEGYCCGCCGPCTARAHAGTRQGQALVGVGGFRGRGEGISPACLYQRLPLQFHCRTRLTGPLPCSLLDCRRELQR